MDRPVWIVTFSGSDVQIDPAGPAPGSGAHHSVTAVIDAASGTYLMGFSYH